MKKVFEVLGIVVVALVIGMGSALWVLNSLPRLRAVENRGWTSSPLVGSVQANMYLRATIARTGLFALSRTEALYYSAFTDENGDPLRSECDYVIEGGDLPARWWSITAYDEDHYLIPNTLNRYSYNVKNLRRDANGRYKIHLSRTPKEENWIPAAKQGKISVSLRAYNPTPALREDMAYAELPKIRKVDCR